jgi:hypothetical protein
LSFTRLDGAAVGKIDDLPLVAALDRGMRGIDEARQPFIEPVIAPSLPPVIIHSLLNHNPLGVIGHDKPMQIKIEPILDGGAINLCDEPACGGERQAIDADAVADGRQFIRGFARLRATSAADMDSKLTGQRCQSTL